MNISFGTRTIYVPLTELARLTDEEFNLFWALLGLMVRHRALAQKEAA